MMPRIVVWVGCVVLAATAAFHASGWSGVAEAVDGSGLSAFMAAVVKGLWLYASYHWLFLALLAALAVGHPSRLARLVLALSAALLAVDALLLLVTIGPFVGEALLAFAAVCFAVGAARLRPASGG